MLLLDTRALVWAVADPARLSDAARRAIDQAPAQGGLTIASISVWELAALFARGRLRGPGTVDQAVRLVIDRTGVGVRDITPAIAALAATLPDDVSRDPVGRLVAATAIAEGLPLVTSDPALAAFPRLRVIW